jgi:osmotically inducible protein OsmC
MATRQGSAEWKGDLQSGSGELVVGEGVFTGAYSFKSRFEEGEGTNPEELIGAALAACYSMQLSHMLAEAGHEPASVNTTASVHLERGDSGPEIQRIDLETVGVVPDIDQEHLEKHAAEAKDACLVSNALAGVGEITVAATLG